MRQNYSSRSSLCSAPAKTINGVKLGPICDGTHTRYGSIGHGVPEQAMCSPGVSAPLLRSASYECGLSFQFMTLKDLNAGAGVKC